MGRKASAIESLYEYKIEELVELKNNINSKYSRLVLTVVTMRYYGHSNSEIINATGLSKPSIVRHITDWNRLGIKAIEDHRGGSDSKLEPEMVDDLLYVAINKSPIDFEFTSHNWTCELLSLYIERTYGIKVSNETIRVTLISHGLSYKRAQPKPTKADKVEQETFKKNVRTTRYFRVFI
jgi:transposase